MEQDKKYYFKNREKISEKRRKYYVKNQKSILERNKKYREINRETINQKARNKNSIYIPGEPLIILPSRDMSLHRNNKINRKRR